jgi:hypothetical protein
MQEHRIGEITSARNASELQAFLSEKLKQSNSRAAFRDDILRTARTEFDAAAIRERLWNAWRG